MVCYKAGFRYTLADSDMNPSPEQPSPTHSGTPFGGMQTPANASAGSAAPTAAASLPFTFSGSAREYFPICLVNLLLSICTLGIYSAWAKVRTLRWFYGHTNVGGHSFDYHATGGQIFKGRVLAILVIALLALPGLVHPFLQLLSLLAFGFLIPWAINASLRFQMRVSSWRNVRFDFSGTYGRAFWIYVGLPVALAIGAILLIFLFAWGMERYVQPAAYRHATVGPIIAATIGFVAVMLLASLAATPIFARMRAVYIAGNTQLGTAPFTLALSLKRLYRLMGRSLLAALAVGIGASVLFYALFKQSGMNFGTDGGLHEAQAAGVFGGIFGFYLAVGIFTVHFIIHMRNEVLNQLVMADAHRLRSTLSPWKVIWILLSNAVVVAFTLGLMLPWAKVRMSRYVCDNVTLLAHEDALDAFVNSNSRPPSSAGGEFSAMEGLSAGLGL